MSSGVARPALEPSELELREWEREFGVMAAKFEYAQAEEIRDVFARHGVRYLFIGKSGAILLGFPDTTQDAVLYVEKSADNGDRTVTGLRELGFELSEEQAEEIRRGKDFVQLKNGPFDLDLIFAPDGIETFADAWARHVEVEGFPVCNLDHIIASKAATNRVKDRESLPRLIAYPRLPQAQEEVSFKGCLPVQLAAWGRWNLGKNLPRGWYI